MIFVERTTMDSIKNIKTTHRMIVDMYWSATIIQQTKNDVELDTDSTA